LIVVYTPEFILWSLEYRCSPRGELDGSEPERIERQLRAARAASQARCDGRVFEGIAVDPPNGFRIEDALAIYGGEDAVRCACADCPANALAGDDHPHFRDVPAPALPQLAGCYGCVRLPEDPSGVHAAIDEGIERVCGSVPWEDLCSVTAPRWYGLWLDSPLWAEHLLMRFNVLQAAIIDDEVCRRDIADLLIALNVAASAGLRIVVQLFPPGRVEGTWWRLAPHCPRCKAPWRSGARNCAVCGHVGTAAQDQKRHARGLRPYYPLERLMGREQAAAFIRRYESFRARQSSPDQPPDLEPPAPRDNLPAD
jgi:hypothetical protein